MDFVKRVIDNSVRPGAEKQIFEYGLVEKRILITGANGQLGSEMWALSQMLPSAVFFFTDIDTLDLCDAEAVRDFVRRNGIEYIVNCAAYTAVDKAEEDEGTCYKVNRDAVENLAKAADGIAKIIHVSTDYVFDGTADKPYVESYPVNPQSVYGKSKLAGEQVLLEFCKESIIIRTAWLYSSFGNNFVKTMMRLGKERDSLNVVADQVGSPTYARDLAEAILTIIVRSEQKQEFSPGIYHYSNEGVCSWYEFTLKIHELAGITSCRVQPITTAEYPVKAARPAYSVLCKDKIKETFQLEVPAWEDSLRLCVKLLNQ